MGSLNDISGSDPHLDRARRPRPASRQRGARGGPRGARGRLPYPPSPDISTVRSATTTSGPTARSGATNAGASASPCPASPSGFSTWEACPQVSASFTPRPTAAPKSPPSDYAPSLPAAAWAALSSRLPPPPPAPPVSSPPPSLLPPAAGGGVGGFDFNGGPGAIEELLEIAERGGADGAALAARHDEA